MMSARRRSATSRASKHGAARLHVEHNVHNFVRFMPSANFPVKAAFSDEHKVVAPDEAIRGPKDSMQT